MTIGEIINYYGDDFRPYVGSLVNHLPMGQLAIYKMTKDLDRVKSYSKSFLERTNIDPIQDNYPVINTMDEVVGDRNSYEACLDLVRRDLADSDMDDYLNQILNKYNLGLSSGLFHTSIRLAYAIEGLRLDPTLAREVERALAYYITAYRESKLFIRKINPSRIKEEMDNLVSDNYIRSILEKHQTLGSKLKAMYNENDFLDKGFVIDGNADQKIDALLDLLIPAYYFSGNILILHCITGLHALIVLKDHFDNYPLALDILTTSIIAHLLTTRHRNYNREINDLTYISCDAILDIASDSSDVHAIKLAYTCCQLKKLYNKNGLEEIAIKRIRNL